MGFGLHYVSSRVESYIVVSAGSHFVFVPYYRIHSAIDFPPFFLNSFQKFTLHSVNFSITKEMLWKISFPAIKIHR